jgi:hypothetical protein
MIRFCLTGALALLFVAQPASAGDRRTGGKLLLTNGVTSVEGASGGGLSTWAVIAGNETRDGIGGKANATRVALPDFDLESLGAAVGVTRAAGATLGLGRGFTFRQEVYGAKLRLIGDAVWEQNSWIPQIAIGVQHKRAERGAVIRALGGRHDRGTDFYLAATKVVLSRSIVLNATVRATKANQFGLLGFGGDRHNRYRPQFEGSAGLMISPRLIIGVEARTKPNNLGFAREQKAADVFAAWALTRNVSLTAALVDLGDIATVRRQRGTFLSIQGSF